MHVAERARVLQPRRRLLIAVVTPNGLGHVVLGVADGDGRRVALASIVEPLELGLAC